MGGTLNVADGARGRRPKLMVLGEGAEHQASGIRCNEAELT